MLGSSPLRSLRVLMLPLMLSLAGCAGTSAGYPSLAPRPIEALSLAEPVAPHQPTTVADPAAVARYAPLIAQARADDLAFRAILEGAQQALARGRSAPEGSDAWTAAQMAFSRVQAAREPVTRALSKLDAARSSPSTLEGTGEAIAAEQAFEQVRQIDQTEAASLRDVFPSGG